MHDRTGEDRARYYGEAESWAQDRERAQRKLQRMGWIVAGVATIVALCEAIAIVVLTPLKTVVPYTLLVDRETGYVEALKPLDRDMVAPDRALVRSFLAQYVIARESFDIDTLNDDYRKVALWSVDEARNRYIAGMQASNPASPLATLPRRALVSVQIRSVSSLGPNTSLVRFSTTRSDPGAQPAPPQTWAAVITYRFTGAAMSADDRLLNPLGFQVMRYRRDAEAIPDVETPPQTLVAPGAVPLQGAMVRQPVRPAGPRVAQPSGTAP